MSDPRVRKLDTGVRESRARGESDARGGRVSRSSAQRERGFARSEPMSSKSMTEFPLTIFVGVSTPLAPSASSLEARRIAFLQSKYPSMVSPRGILPVIITRDF